MINRQKGNTISDGFMCINNFYMCMTLQNGQPIKRKWSTYFPKKNTEI